MRVNREAFKRLIDGDIAKLNDAMPHHSLERQHIEHVLNNSINTHYVIFPAVERIVHQLDSGELDTHGNGLDAAAVATLREWIKRERGVPS